MAGYSFIRRVFLRVSWGWKKAGQLFDMSYQFSYRQKEKVLRVPLPDFVILVAWASCKLLIAKFYKINQMTLWFEYRKFFLFHTFYLKNKVPIQTEKSISILVGFRC